MWRKSGQYGERTVSNLAWAEFLHFTARPVAGEIDPHLHAHAFVPNLCWDHVEHAWKAIDVASLKENAPHWQAAFQKRFGQRLEGLGYAVVWQGGNFEIAGISRGLIDRFSRRTTHINHTAAKLGVTDPADKAKLGAFTRERKRKDATMPELRAGWRKRLTDEERAALAQATRKQRYPVPGYRQRPDELPAHTDAVPMLGDARQRQRLAMHERARATHAVARPAPTPRQPQSRGYGR